MVSYQKTSFSRGPSRIKRLSKRYHCTMELSNSSLPNIDCLSIFRLSTALSFFTIMLRDSALFTYSEIKCTLVYLDVPSMYLNVHRCTLYAHQCTFNVHKHTLYVYQCTLNVHQCTSMYPNVHSCTKNC